MTWASGNQRNFPRRENTGSADQRPSVQISYICKGMHRVLPMDGMRPHPLGYTVHPILGMVVVLVAH